VIIIRESQQQLFDSCLLITTSHIKCSNTKSVPVSDWSFVETFKWEDIKQIQITGNQIISFKAGIFTKFTNVETIDINGNQLKTVDFNEFASNSKLKDLNVGYNQIIKIQTIKDSAEINITNLEIHNNDLTDITELCKIRQLKKLNLSRNRRIDFSKVKFSCWSGLTHLFLTDTNLKELGHDYRMLTGCNKLEYLNLMENDLELICLGRRFPILSQLQHLNIRNNSLIDLDVEGLKRKFQVLSKITTTGNEWSCDYLIYNLKIALKKSNIEEFRDNLAILTYIEKSCIKNEYISKTRYETIQKCKDIEESKSSFFFVPYWIFVILECVLFMTEVVLLKFYNS
jgi:Leucine-rich repeat (LRR) protein